MVSVTGDSNFSMDSTCLTVGGFSQPSVARSIIEQNGSAEIGLSQRFLWLFPQPLYCKFNSLEAVDNEFSTNLGKYDYHMCTFIKHWLFYFSSLTP